MYVRQRLQAFHGQGTALEYFSGDHLGHYLFVGHWRATRQFAKELARELAAVAGGGSS